jgi:hypothetical protein
MCKKELQYASSHFLVLYEKNLRPHVPPIFFPVVKFNFVYKVIVSILDRGTSITVSFQFYRNGSPLKLEANTSIFTYQ